VPKRTLWFGVGATIGACGSLWTKYKIEKRIAGSTPLQITIATLKSSRSTLATLNEAVKTGSREMKKESSRLRSEFGLTTPLEGPRMKR
ncbi:unnamed protein product, partial [Acidithrix sp. C25]